MRVPKMAKDTRKLWLEEPWSRFQQPAKLRSLGTFIQPESKDWPGNVRILCARTRVQVWKDSGPAHSPPLPVAVRLGIERPLLHFSGEGVELNVPVAK